MKLNYMLQKNCKLSPFNLCMHPFLFVYVYMGDEIKEVVKLVADSYCDIFGWQIQPRVVLSQGPSVVVYKGPQHGAAC